MLTLKYLKNSKEIIPPKKPQKKKLLIKNNFSIHTGSKIRFFQSKEKIDKKSKILEIGISPIGAKKKEG